MRNIFYNIILTFTYVYMICLYLLFISYIVYIINKHPEHDLQSGFYDDFHVTCKVMRQYIFLLKGAETNYVCLNLEP